MNLFLQEGAASFWPQFVDRCLMVYFVGAGESGKSTIVKQMK